MTHYALAYDEKRNATDTERYRGASEAIGALDSYTSAVVDSHEQAAVSPPKDNRHQDSTTYHHTSLYRALSHAWP